LKRKSIRVYPDNQKVGLYYSQYLDRYVAIPFGMSKKTTPFTAINEGLDEAVNWHAAAQDYFKDNPEDSDKKTKEKLNIHPSQFEDDEDRAKHIEKLKKFVTQKAAQGKIRSIHYSGVTSKYLGGDAEKRSLKKTANKEFNKSSSFMDYAAGHTGVAVGNAVRKVAHGLRDKIRAIRNKPVGDAKYANAPKIPKIEEPKKEVPAPEVRKVKAQETPHGLDPVKNADTIKWLAKESFRQKITERRRLEEEKRQYGAADAAADAASFIPGPAGSAASLASAGLSVSRGDYVGAALDTIGAVPLVGYAAKAAKVARAAKTASEVGKVGKAVDTASDVAKVADKVADVAKPASVASKVGGTLAKGAGKTLKLGGKILKGAALIGAGLAAGAGSSSANDDKKDLTPAKFDMKVKTNTPSDTGTKSGVDTRTSNLYRKSFEGSMKEETAKDDEDKTKTSTPRRFLKPAAASNSKVKISAPKPAGVTTGVDARMRKYERDFYGQQNESVMSQIKFMINEDVTEMQLNIGENTLKINNTIAKKVVGVYESLNTENKKKMEDMLNEGTTESFMKLINFAVRQ
jgi:hypothetical protein